jgi:hypothetical protein
MNPQFAERLLTRFESGHPVSEERGEPIPGFDSSCLLTSGLPKRLEEKILSQSRARMAVMRQDPINAALWSLAGFDRALIHFAELREWAAKKQKTGARDEELEVALDRTLSVYLESQSATLMDAAGINRRELDQLVTQRLGDASVNYTGIHAIACTEDPLMLELFSYALRLGVLTNHDAAPWNRFSAVVDDCFEQMHPKVLA